METKIAFSPRGNKVLLRADFEVSTLNILNNEEINKIPAKAYTVMAVAENVKGLNVGDKVNWKTVVFLLLFKFRVILKHLQLNRKFIVTVNLLLMLELLSLVSLFL